MQYGGGGIGYVSNVQPPAGVNNARSGTSVVAGFVELGLNPLLHNTQIITDGFDFEFGDFNGIGNGSFFRFDDTLQVLRVAMNGVDTDLLIDKANDYWAIGDVTNFIQPVMELQTNAGGNSTALLYCPDPGGLNEYASFQLEHANAPAPKAILDIRGAANRSQLTQTEQRLVWEENTGVVTRHLDLDFQARDYAIGDIDGLGTGLHMRIVDTAPIFLISDTAGNYFNIDPTNQQFNLDTQTGVLLQGDGIAGTMNFVAPNGIVTSDPGTGPGQWKLGQVQAAAVAFDPNNYVEVSIGGVVVKLAIAV